MVDRAPYSPTEDEWPDVFNMLCGHCAHARNCEVIERMIEMKAGGPWPEGGWVTDPGAGVTCLSYEPNPLMMEPLTRQRLRQVTRKSGPMCSGCAARKGSEASVSLHTRRDFHAAVKARALFVCHEDPALRRPCGGWCRAVQPSWARDEEG